MTDYEMAGPGAVTVQTADFDGLGRRIRKVVTNSGPHDGTVVCYYDGQRIIETRDGSGNMVQQFIHGTQYIDELVMMRRAGHGDLYIHQDANWNVIGATDLNGRLVERYEYTPYGELTVHQESSYGDYDGDQDVNGDENDPDRAAIVANGACRDGNAEDACRVLDLDFDGNYDDDDLTLFDALDDGYMVRPGRRFSSAEQPFGHQGLLHEPEVGQYQNRARQYDPGIRRFLQPDLLALVPRPYALRYSGRTRTHAVCDFISEQQSSACACAVSPSVARLRDAFNCDLSPSGGPNEANNVYEYEHASPADLRDPLGLSSWNAPEPNLVGPWTLVHCASGMVFGIFDACGFGCGLGAIWEYIEPHIWPGWDESGANQAGDAAAVCLCCLLM